MLSSRIRPQDTTTTTDDTEDSESLLTSFLPHLFPDEAHACLGDPGQTLLYTSPSPPLSGQYSTLQIEVPGEAGGGRELFAHYLWGGALVVADGVEGAAIAENKSSSSSSSSSSSWRWDVRDKRVLELGAGAALPSLIAALAGAASVTITDHPSSSALSGPAQNNISTNISSSATRERVSVHPHAWGEVGVSTSAAGFAAENAGCFDRIICADCLWMKGQHENLVRSIDWFLAPGDARRGEETGGGVAWVVAGFHTGRDIVASFLDTAVSMGLVVEDVWERDMNAEAEVTREWCPVREGEGPEYRARWCMVAFLRKKTPT